MSSTEQSDHNSSPCNSFCVIWEAQPEDITQRSSYIGPVETLLVPQISWFLLGQLVPQGSAVWYQDLGHPFPLPASYLGATENRVPVPYCQSSWFETPGALQLLDQLVLLYFLNWTLLTFIQLIIYPATSTSVHYCRISCMTGYHWHTVDSYPRFL